MRIKNTFVALLVTLAGSSAAWALPSLQLDIEGGVYDTSTETTVSNGSVFNLSALADASKMDIDPSGTYYLSVALMPSEGSTVFGGSFMINDVTYTSADTIWGTPPIDKFITDGLAPHSIYPTSYLEIAFQFTAGATVDAYDVEENTLVADMLLLQNIFSVNTSNLSAPYQLHFDLYTYVQDGQQDKIKAFAPFSHDAESGGTTTEPPQPPPTTPPTTVPDGGTALILFGLALIGLSVFHRGLELRSSRA